MEEGRKEGKDEKKKAGKRGRKKGMTHGGKIGSWEPVEGKERKEGRKEERK